MMRFIRHYADVIPSKGVVLVRRQLYESNNSKGLFRKKNLIVDTVLEMKIENDIPFEIVEVEEDYFDSKAFQMDDRFFTTKKTVKRNNPEIMKQVAQKALIGFNTEPEQL